MDELDEVLDIAQRQKRSQIMRRYAAKIERKRELAQKRLAPEKNIKKRAYAQARQAVRKKFAGARGAEYEKLGPSEKIAIDRAIEKKSALIKKLALRLIPKIKQAEAKRLQSFTQGQALKNHGHGEGKAVSESLNSLFAESFPPMTNTSTSQLPGENGSNKNDVQSKAKKKAKTGDIIIYNRFGEEIVVSKSVFEGLSKKSEKSGIDIETLGEVYSRGCDAWEDGSKYTQQQYAFARVNSYINEGSSYYELDADLHGDELTEKRGLWDNIHAKRKRIKAGSGERMRKPGSKGAPTAQNFKDAQESVEIEESFRKWQIQQNLGKSKKEFLSPPDTVGGMNTKRIHHNEKHDIEVYHGMQVYKTTPHYVFHNDKLVHMTSSRDNAMNHAEKLGRKLDKEEKKTVKEDIDLEEGIKEKIKGAIRREKAKDMPLIQTRRDYAMGKAGDAYEKGETRKGNQYSAWAERSRKKEGVRSTNPTGKYRTKTSDYTNEETESVGTKIRKNMEIVDRKPKTPGVYTKQVEVKNKIIDEEGNVENDPKKRLIGTDSLVKVYKKDTPGQDGDLNESFNIAFAAGVGVSLTAADLGMKAQGGFALHPSVIAEMEARELEEDAVSAEKKPVYMPPRRKQDGSYTAAKTILRKSGRKIIDAQEPEDADSDEHDGK